MLVFLKSTLVGKIFFIVIQNFANAFLQIIFIPIFGYNIFVILFPICIYCASQICIRNAERIRIWTGYATHGWNLGTVLQIAEKSCSGVPWNSAASCDRRLKYVNFLVLKKSIVHTFFIKILIFVSLSFKKLTRYCDVSTSFLFKKLTTSTLFQSYL